MTKKTSNDEKFVMNFFQKGNGNTQIASVNNFTAKDYMPDDEEESEETEELTEIEKAIQENSRSLTAVLNGALSCSKIRTSFKEYGNEFKGRIV